MTLWVLSSVFLVGLLSGVHCAGMCGGLVGAFSMNLPPQAKTFPLHLAYNSGRITSYAVAGAIAGAVGEAGLLLNNVLPVQLALYVAANLMLVALGLYLAGVTRLLSPVEALGARLWRIVSPLGRRWLPAHTAGRAYRLGLVWGWLPCGLVYSVLATAIFTGDTASGAAIMLAFGLGTLPNLMLAGLFWRRLKDFFAHAAVRTGAGALVLGLGIAGLARASGNAEALRAGMVCHFF
jgi:sulfite exporter TauE/SafE